MIDHPNFTKTVEPNGDVNYTITVDFSEDEVKEILEMANTKRGRNDPVSVIRTLALDGLGRGVCL